MNEQQYAAFENFPHVILFTQKMRTKNEFKVLHPPLVSRNCVRSTLCNQSQNMATRCKFDFTTDTFTMDKINADI